MSAHAQPFSQQSIKLLADDVEAFFVANPTAVPISITNVVEGATFYAILVYTI